MFVGFTGREICGLSDRNRPVLEMFASFGLSLQRCLCLPLQVSCLRYCESTVNAELNPPLLIVLLLFGQFESELLHMAMIASKLYLSLWGKIASVHCVWVSIVQYG